MVVRLARKPPGKLRGILLNSDGAIVMPVLDTGLYGSPLVLLTTVGKDLVVMGSAVDVNEGVPGENRVQQHVADVWG